ncbi:hypothetical protein Thini_2125 [Thiothrix nivea DSM 5205]|uniref:Uncharacterized protein n=1 Tax=Thiothrix nivea (strain ATCC 35100 / DSM 5205 / JP2) TaxID=870187 RepID=A0A656HE59_THINJ|nr:hypothetical protein Thini_2125 [Thiothrix nivea DSM 5205]
MSRRVFAKCLYITKIYIFCNYESFVCETRVSFQFSQQHICVSSAITIYGILKITKPIIWLELLPCCNMTKAERERRNINSDT